MTRLINYTNISLIANKIQKVPVFPNLKDFFRISVPLFVKHIHQNFVLFRYGRKSGVNWWVKFYIDF